MFSSKDIAWSEETYSLMELNLDEFQYPALVKIVQGYYDKTPEATYDPEQVRLDISYVCILFILWIRCA